MYDEHLDTPNLQHNKFLIHIIIYTFIKQIDIQSTVLRFINLF
jgi:hypothetical protein